MDLIQNAMQSVCTLANGYLNNVDRRPDPWVVLTSIVGHDGTLNPEARDKIVMTLYNITREPFASSYRPSPPASPTSDARGALPVISPPIYLNLHVMFMANFPERGYSDGLAALSRLISYFQQTPVFSAQNAAQLAPAIEQLTLDLENLCPVDVNYVMSMLGTRYLPSAFYKLRMLPFQSSAMLARTYAVQGSGLDLAPAAAATAVGAPA